MSQSPHRTPIAVDPSFTVIDETEHWIVVDKAAPLIVHETGNPFEVTLMDGLEQLLSYEIANGQRPALIHRLDRETSGVILVSKTLEWTRQFNRAMGDRLFSKTYHAIVHGWPDWPDSPEHHISCDQPLIRAGEVEESLVYVRQCVHPDGLPSRTDFRCLERFTHNGEPLSLIEARPLTGRTHQIRAHLGHLGHPIVGDKIYRDQGRTYCEFLKLRQDSPLCAALLLPRHALHASQLSLDIPGCKRTWEAPIPRDFNVILPAQIQP